MSTFAPAKVSVFGTRPSTQIRSCPGAQPRRSYSRLHAITADSASFTVNEWIWAEPTAILTEVLQKDDQINIPDPDLVPVLAARFAAETMVADAISPETRRLILQCLVRMALPNPTAVDTVLGRLILAMLDQPAPLPLMLQNLEVPDSAAVV